MENILNSIEEIRREIIKFNQSEEYQKLSNFFEYKTFYEILNISRRENIHSSFLGWFLNPEESHGLGEYTMKKFLDCVFAVLNEGNQKYALKKFPQNFIDSLITNDYELSNIRIELEKSITTDSRLDIFIQADLKFDNLNRKLRILIENKVKAKEHNEQTNKYYNWLLDNPMDETIDIPIFLAPVTNIKLLELEKPECISPEFIQINYQFLLDYLFKPCLQKDLSPQAKLLIDDYIRNLSLPSLKNNDDNNGVLIMAIGNEERELLKKFWEKNKSLLLSAYYAISTDSEQEPEMREKAEEIIASQTKSKDYSNLKLTINGIIVAENIKKTDIGRVLVKELITSGIVNSENFSKLEEDKSSSFKLLKERESITEAETTYRRYKVNENDKIEFLGKTYYASGNWGITNLPKLKKFIYNNFIGVEIKSQEEI